MTAAKSATLTPDFLSFASVSELAQETRTRRLAAVELLEHFLLRTTKYNPRLKAYITVSGEQALEAARAADAATVGKEVLPPLHGIPLAVKDTLFTRGIRTTAGCLLYQNFVPEDDASAVLRLRRAGAIVLGKTTTPEFASGGGLSYNLLLQDDCHNPWGVERTGGASSGGSAVAVSAGLAPMAVGSDAGGSIRTPSAWCGVYGFKPSRGRVATYGGFESMPLFNVVGPLTRTVRDAALMLDVMAGFDARDPLSLREPNPQFLLAHNKKVGPLTVAWSPDMGRPRDVDPEIAAVASTAVKRFEALGWRVEEVSPKIEDWYEAFRVIAYADLYAGHGSLLDASTATITAALRSNLEQGRAVLGSDYAKALWKIDRVRAQVANFFEQFDLLITPTVATKPPRIAEALIGYDKPGPALAALNVFSPLANVVDSPSASVPCGFTSDGLPVGLMITARRGLDDLVLQASAAFEELSPWRHLTPPLRDETQSPQDGGSHPI